MTETLLFNCETEIAAQSIQSELEALNFRHQETSQERALTGIEWEVLLALPVTGVLVREAARVIVAWLEANAGRRAKFGDTELRGYSPEDVERLIGARSKEAYDSRRNGA